MPSSLASRLQLTSGVELKRFDSDLIVFDPLSWQTHLVNAAGAVLVEELSAGAASVEHLQAVFRAHYPDQDQTSSDRSVLDLVDNLVDLGLVEALQAPSCAVSGD